jgi:hypothetical protein
MSGCRSGSILNSRRYRCWTNKATTPRHRALDRHSRPLADAPTFAIRMPGHVGNNRR